MQIGRTEAALCPQIGGTSSSPTTSIKMHMNQGSWLFAESDLGSAHHGTSSGAFLRIATLALDLNGHFIIKFQDEIQCSIG